jgi:N6-adenosine-specific RNA methylase IME4
MGLCDENGVEWSWRTEGGLQLMHLSLSRWAFKSPGNQMSKTGCSINGKLALSLSLSLSISSNNMEIGEEYIDGCICRCNGIN